MTMNRAKQYTIRQIPGQLDHALRGRSKKQRKSLNTVVIDALWRGVGLHDERVKYHDLDSLIGSWKNDPAFDEAIELQNRIDWDQWK